MLAASLNEGEMECGPGEGAQPEAGIPYSVAKQQVRLPALQLPAESELGQGRGAFGSQLLLWLRLRSIPSTNTEPNPAAAES